MLAVISGRVLRYTWTKGLVGGGGGLFLFPSYLLIVFSPLRQHPDKVARRKERMEEKGWRRNQPLPPPRRQLSAAAVVKPVYCSRTPRTQLEVGAL